MHISFLTTEYPHPYTGNGGGIGTSIKNLARALAERAKAVTVFVVSSKEDMVFYDNKVRIVCIKEKKYKMGGWYLHRKHIEKRLNKYIVEDKIELLEAPDWTGLTAFMKLKCPVVIKIHGSDTYFCHLEKRPQKWKNRWFENMAFKNADAFIGVSAFALELTNKLFKIKCDTPQIVIYNGIDISKFRFAGDVTEPIVLYFGTLIRKKGCLELPLIFNEVVKHIPKARLILAGSDSVDIITGNKSTWNLMLPLFSNEALKQTNYVGKVPYSEMYELISKADVCVFPSFAEAFPVSWLEAMAMGKAMVTSDIGWAAEAVEHGVTGFCCAPDQHLKYAAYIVELIGNEELRKSIANNAVQRVQKYFDNVIIATKHLNFYQTIIIQ